MSGGGSQIAKSVTRDTVDRGWRHTATRAVAAAPRCGAGDRGGMPGDRARGGVRGGWRGGQMGQVGDIHQSTHDAQIGERQVGDTHQSTQHLRVGRHRSGTSTVCRVGGRSSGAQVAQARGIHRCQDRRLRRQPSSSAGSAANWGHPSPSGPLTSTATPGTSSHAGRQVRDTHHLPITGRGTTEVRGTVSSGQ